MTQHVNIILQWIAVACVIGASVIWMLLRHHRKRCGKTASCCDGTQPAGERGLCRGCALSEVCNDKNSYKSIK